MGPCMGEGPCWEVRSRWGQCRIKAVAGRVTVPRAEEGTSDMLLLREVVFGPVPGRS